MFYPEPSLLLRVLQEPTQGVLQTRTDPGGSAENLYIFQGIELSQGVQLRTSCPECSTKNGFILQGFHEESTQEDLKVCLRASLITLLSSESTTKTYFIVQMSQMLTIYVIIIYNLN